VQEVTICDGEYHCSSILELPATGAFAHNHGKHVILKAAWLPSVHSTGHLAANTMLPARSGRSWKIGLWVREGSMPSLHSFFFTGMLQ